jgi:uncharacterized membrane protein YeaQ/YmgE (transglycosylase-associated protein family)
MNWKRWHFLSYILVGAVAGWLAGKILESYYGPTIDMAMGIGGAIAAGLLMRSAGLDGYNGAITTTAVAVVGGGIFTVIAGLVNVRRMSARQL